MSEYKSKIEESLKTIKVADIMSRFAITTKETTKIPELAHLMMRFKISGVPVVSDKGEAVGIVTATDLFNKMKKVTDDIDNGLDPMASCQASISEITTRDVFCITEDMSLFEVIKLMCGKNIHTLPVVSGNEITGVVGRRDVINACYSLMQDKVLKP